MNGKVAKSTYTEQLRAEGVYDGLIYGGTTMASDRGSYYVLNYYGHKDDDTDDLHHFVGVSARQYVARYGLKRAIENAVAYSSEFDIEKFLDNCPPLASD